MSTTPGTQSVTAIQVKANQDQYPQLVTKTLSSPSNIKKPM